MKHKTLSFLLAVLMSMVAGVASAHDFEVDGIYYNITSSTYSSFTVAITYCGSSSTLYTNRYAGNVTIPEKVRYADITWYVTSIGDYAFSGCTGLTSITITNIVYSIGEYAFNGCKGLTSIEIPGSVTSIGDCTFAECSGLTSVSIPNSVTSIGNGAFRNCSSLTSIEIPGRVTSIGNRAFRNCSSLTSIEIPNSVTSIGNNAFSDCSGLTDVTINSNAIASKNYTSSSCLTDIFGSQVTNCAFGERVEKIGEYACYNLSKLKSVLIGINVKEIGYNAFKGCNLTKAEFASVEHYLSTKYNSSTSGDYGYNCSANPFYLAHHLYMDGEEVKNLVVPEGVENIGSYAFYNASEITAVTIPSSVTSIGNYAFSDCSGLTDVTINSNAIASKTYTSSLRLSNFFGSQVTSFAFGEGVEKIGDFACYNLSNLKSVLIGNNVKEIGYNAFEGCNLSKAEFASVEHYLSTKYNSSTSGDYGYNCSANPFYLAHHLYMDGEEVKNLVVPEGVENIGNYAFCNGSEITAVTIPSSVTSIGGSAFSGCTALKAVTINSNAIASKTYTGSSNLSSIFGSLVESYIFGEGVEKIGAYACYNSSKITTLSLPETLTEIGEKAFSGCSGLPSVTIPNNLTSIGDYVFEKCSGMTFVIIPSSVTSIGTSAFSGCSGLTKTEFSSIGHYLKGINFSNGFGSTSNPLYLAHHLYINGNEVKDLTIPNNVTSIGGFSFDGCSGLTSITIPSSVADIGSSAFRGCTGLTSVHICDLAAWCGISFGNSSANPLTNAHHLYLNDEEIKDLVIPDGVETIGGYAFINGSEITAVNIPSSVTSIGTSAFSGCSGLTKTEFSSIGHYLKGINFSNGFGSTSNPLCLAHHLYINGNEVRDLTIPNNVTTIGGSAFDGCSGLTSITIPSSVANIGSSAFKDCTGLTSIVIPNSVTSIGEWTFYRCSGLNSVSIGKSVTSIGGSAFSGCTALKAVTINSNAIASKTYTSSSRLLDIFGSQVTSYTFGEGVEKIGDYACYGCSNMTSVTIPESVTAIARDAFQGCLGLNKVSFASIKSLCGISFASSSANPLYYAQHLYIKDEEVTEVVIPEDVTVIGNYAFCNCSGLTSMEIHNNVISIGASAFLGCSGLTSIVIPSSVTSIGSSAFSGCTGLTSVSLNCQPVDTWFNGLKGIQQLTIGDNVETINASAFRNCTNMGKAVIGDNVTSVGANAFPASTSLYANRGTTSLLALWNANYKQPYETGTDNVLEPSSLAVEEKTQMTATVRVNDFYPEFENTLNDNVIDEAMNVFTSQPNKGNTVTLRVTKDGVTYTAPNLSYTTLPISPTAKRAQGTASSMVVKASYLEGDAEVTSQTLTVNGVTVEGDSLYLNGLKPNTTYKATYTIKVNNEYEYTKTVDLKTDALKFENEQPKVITEGNIIVASQSNLDDAEENVGFQWRRNDWTNDFESKSAGAYIYEGMIEGYIRSLNSNYLWKFRPYYQSADGTYYYGSWSGMDPSDFSYFEPTVHTYAKISVNGNSAEVKGYAQRGTDNVVSQGFMYWKASPQPSTVGREKVSSVPSGAQKVEASGTVMEANLTGLDYNTEYCYVAYVTTSEGETFYGEEKRFVTGENPDGIENLTPTLSKGEGAKGVYDLSGRKMNGNVNNRSATTGDACLSKNVNNLRLKKGIYIVNGRKVMIK